MSNGTLCWLEVFDDTQPIPQVQIAYDGGLAQKEVNYLQPHGMRFVPPLDSEGLMVFVNGDRACPVVLNLASYATPGPTGEEAPGTGGLHYLGDFKVYLDGSGNVVLAGDGDSGRTATDAVPIDSKLQTELSRIESDLAAVQTALDTLQAAYDAHTHSVSGVTAGPAAVPTLAPISPTGPLGFAPSAPGPTASTKVLIPSEA